MKFNTPEEMYNYICFEGDLYNAELGIYVFQYNSVGALAIYDIDSIKADKLALQSIKNDDEYWEAYLGPGGKILEVPEFREAYENDTAANYCTHPYLAPSYEFCEKYYNHDGWEDTYFYGRQVLEESKEER